MRLFIIVSLIFHSVLSQKLGADCQVRLEKFEENVPGKCIILTECPEIVKRLSKGKFPKICGYQNLEAVVCCPNTKPKLTTRVQIISQRPNDSNRISKQKCAEYGKSVYRTKHIMTMSGPEIVNISTCVNKANPVLTESIYARQREFPHMALVGVGPRNKKQWTCSGSLISEQYVLTVAHCTISRISGEVQWVRLGDLDFDSPNDDSEIFDFIITQIHRHPKYRPPVLYNDIAVLELNEKVTFSADIRPACLHTGNEDILEKFVLSGWALRGSDLENKGHLRQYKQLRKVENNECNEEYKNQIGRRLADGIVEETLLCTEAPKNDACQISSGAALQVHSNYVYCMYDIVGLTSFGKAECSSMPIVHTRISAYINWIESIVWPQVIQM